MPAVLHLNMVRCFKYLPFGHFVGNLLINKIFRFVICNKMWLLVENLGCADLLTVMNKKVSFYYFYLQ